MQPAALLARSTQLASGSGHSILFSTPEYTWSTVVSLGLPTTRQTEQVQLRADKTISRVQGEVKRAGFGQLSEVLEGDLTAASELQSREGSQANTSSGRADSQICLLQPAKADPVLVCVNDQQHPKAFVLLVGYSPSIPPPGVDVFPGPGSPPVS